MAEYLSQNDIFEFAEDWRSASGFAESDVLTEEQIAKFVGELQERVALMDYRIPEGSVVIGYSGNSNGEQAFADRKTKTLRGDTISRTLDPKQEVWDKRSLDTDPRFLPATKDWPSVPDQKRELEMPPSHT